jgi:hypothetical protein
MTLMNRVKRSCLVVVLASVLFFCLEPRAHAFLDGYRKGPHLGLQFPHLYDLGYEARHLTSDFSMGLGLGVVPKITFGANTQVGVSHLEFRGRWHPFSGAFYIGGALGSQTINATGRQTVDVGGTPVPVKIDLKLASPYFMTHIGWMWIFDSGFTLGLELGTQRGGNGRSDLELTVEDPSTSKTVAEIQASPAYQLFESGVENELGKLGKIALPYYGVRFGWMF